MKFGIIGAGRHAQNKVMPAIVKSGNEVSAIYSRDAAKANDIGLKYFSKPYNDMETFLAGDFDAVYISSPNFLHHDHAMACLKHGKHVLLEKQMTLENSDAANLVRASGKKILGVGFHMRFHPAVIEMRKMIADGKIGRPVHVTGTWAGFSSGKHDDPARKWWDEDDKAGGGSVMGTGVHVLDTINYVLGKHPSRVSAFRSPRKSVIETTEIISLDFGNGDTGGTAVSSREMMEPDNSLRVEGTQGTIAGRGIFGVDVKGSLELNGSEVRKYSGGDMYEGEVRAFVSATRGEKTGIAQARDGEIVVRTVNAAFRSDYDDLWLDL